MAKKAYTFIADGEAVSVIVSASKRRAMQRFAKDNGIPLAEMKADIEDGQLDVPETKHFAVLK